MDRVPASRAVSRILAAVSWVCLLAAMSLRIPAVDQWIFGTFRDVTVLVVLYSALSSVVAGLLSLLRERSWLPAVPLVVRCRAAHSRPG